MGDEIPISDILQAAVHLDAFATACTGGEDYELVLVGDDDTLENLADFVGSLKLSTIGFIAEGAGVRVEDDVGKEIRFDKAGWDAFKS